MITLAVRPEVAAAEPTTIPPKSISGGDILRNATLLTVFPIRETGNMLLYFATAFVV